MDKQFLLKKEDIKQLIKLGFSCIASDRITVDGDSLLEMKMKNIQTILTILKYTN